MLTQKGKLINWFCVKAYIARGVYRDYLFVGCMLSIIGCHPNVTSVVTSNGYAFPIVDVVRRYNETIPIGSGRSSTDSILIIKYWVEAQDPALVEQKKADAILPRASFLADSVGFRDIVIRQISPLFASWTGLITSHAIAYHKTKSGRWERVS